MSNHIRSRIVPPQPPAPVPTARPKKAATLPQVTPLSKPEAAAAAATGTALNAHGAQGGSGTPGKQPGTGAQGAAATQTATVDSTKQSDADVVRSTGSMAIATLLSRITGFLRTAALGATVGPAVGSAFNTANTLPNLITEIVLGAVLTSLVVPVLVRAEKDDPDKGAAFIRRLMTLSCSLLIVVTIASVAAAPWLTRLMLGRDSEVNLTQSTAFAYLLLPQIFFYGIFALFMAVLNTKGVFKPGAWAPVANNVVVLLVMLLYWIVPGGLGHDEPAGLTNPHLLLLGIGTTLGVVIQALLLFPSLKKMGIDLRPLWGIDDRLKQFGGMAMAIVVYVGISQAGYTVTNRIAAGADSRAPWIYGQTWMLLQVPYGIIGVTLLTAIMPRLSRSAADGDHKAVVRDLTMGTKLTYIAMIPIIVFMTVFGVEIANGLFAYGGFDSGSADIMGWTVSFSAFTLIPYGLVLLHLRVFYAREEAWTPTFIIAGITTTKVLLSYLAPMVASAPSRVVILLGAANGMSFIAGAVIGALLLRRKLGNLRMLEIAKTSLWALLASAVGALAAKYLNMGMTELMPGLWNTLGSLGALVRIAVVGIVYLLIVGVILFKTGLPEVTAIVGRVPGLRRFAPQEDQQSMPEEEAGLRVEVSPQIQTIDPYSTGPELPPMSAGIVRPPRLVPGAPVANGRFRLLKSHGQVPGARFWQAREQATGRQVALVFVDTSGAPPQKPRTPAAAAAAAAEVARRTRKLAGLAHPNLANNIQISTYRAGCVVVSDWIDGSPLSAVIDPDPGAAALAIASLADAAQTAKDNNTPLGLDDVARIRIDLEGNARLAFPAVLPESSCATDVATCTAAYLALVPEGEEQLAAAQEATTATAATVAANDPTAATPAAQDSALQETPAVVAENAVVAVDDRPAANLAAALRTLGNSGQLHAAAEAFPRPADQAAGFGGKTYTRRGLVAIMISTVVLMIIAALAVVYVLGVFGGDRDEAPVNQDSITKVIPETTVKLGTIGAIEWEPGDPNPDAADNPEEAALAIDGDPATAWHTDHYRMQFGTNPAVKNGVGLLITLQTPMRLSTTSITTDTPGTAVEIYGVSDGAFTELDQAKLLGTAVLEQGTTTVETPTDVAYGRVLVYVTRLPMPDAANIAEVTFKGRVPVDANKKSQQNQP